MTILKYGRLRQKPWHLVLVCWHVLAMSPAVLLAQTPPVAGESIHQEVDAAGLIPRSEFFVGPGLFGFQCDDRGEHLYFQSRQSTSEIQYVDVARPQERHVLQMDRPISSWQPINDGVLFIDTLEGVVRIVVAPLSGAKRVVVPPVVIRSASLLAASRTGRERVLVSIEGEKPGDSGLYELDVSDLSLVKKYPQQPYGALFFDGDLQLIAAHHSTPTEGYSFYRYDASKEEWSSFRDHPWSMDVAMIGGLSRILSVSSDGTSVFFTSNRDTDKCGLYRLDFASGKTTRLAQHEKVDLLPFGHSNDRSGNVTSVVGLYAETKRVVVDSNWQDDFETLDRLLDGDVSFLKSCRDDRLWIVRELCGGPVRLYAFDRDEKKLVYLLSDWPNLQGKPLARRRAFEVTTRDGLHVPVHVYLPVGSDLDRDGIPETPLPTVLYVHGGPWAGIVHWNQDFHWRNFQLLANRGYAVINCDFRGSIGMGKDFVESSRKSWRSRMTLDKVDIAKWATETGIAEAGKMGIWGWSYGGYAALAGLAFSPETYACAISMYGISDMERFAMTPYANHEFWHRWVGDPNDAADRQMLRDASPIRAVERITAPILLTTGSRDVRVPQEQIDSMAQALSEAGRDVVYFYYPEEGHDYRMPESWISFWAISEAFLATHLGGRCEPDRGDKSRGHLVVVQGQAFVDSIK